MKSCYKLFFTSSVFLLVCVNCQREEIENSNELIGQWTLIRTNKAHPYTDLTPENTGISEMLVFNEDHSWYKVQNDTIVDSGHFSTGHGSITLGAIFTYDSIVYIKNGLPIDDGVDYYKIYNDTLFFTPYLAGRFSSYSLPYNGSKWWIRK